MDLKEMMARKRQIFVFGMPGSGKSTISAAIVKYIDTHEDLKLRRDPIGNANGVLVIREWIKKFNKNQFPEQTTAGLFTKIIIEYQKLGSSFILNRLNIYEVAGEDVIKFDPTHSAHKEIAPELFTYLNNSDAVMIMASSKINNINEPEIIRDFLEYLIRTKYKKPICLVLSKYDMIRDDYENHIKAARKLYNGSVKILHDYKNSNILPFSVGISNDGVVFNPDDHSQKYMTELFNWMERG